MEPCERTTCVREIHLKYGRSTPLPKPLLEPSDAAEFFRSVIDDETREHFVAIYLDCKNRPLGWRVVSIGTDTQALVKPALVLQPALLVGANRLIVGHNHPSGDLFPSSEDLALTRELKDACELLGFELLDSIIWTESGNASLIAGRGAV